MEYWDKKQNWDKVRKVLFSLICGQNLSDKVILSVSRLNFSPIESRKA